MAVNSAIILAGGLGTRLRSVVPDLPKPLAPIDGRPFLEYQMDYWIGQGIQRFVLSVGYKHELIEQHFGTRYNGAELDYAVETRPLGTGGGMLLAAVNMTPSGPWLLLNGDTFFEVELASLEGFHRDREADITLSLFRVENNARYMGVELDAEGWVSRLKAPPGGQAQFINGGVYMFGTSALASLGYRPGEPASLEDDIFGKALAGGKRICGCPFAGCFIDIGIPEDYRRAASLFARG